MQCGPGWWQARRRLQCGLGFLRSSPNVNYDYGAYNMESDGNVDISNWSIDFSYGWSSLRAPSTSAIVHVKLSRVVASAATALLSEIPTAHFTKKKIQLSLSGRWPKWCYHYLFISYGSDGVHQWLRRLGYLHFLRAKILCYSPATDTIGDSVFYVEADGGSYISDYLNTYSYGRAFTLRTCTQMRWFRLL